MSEARILYAIVAVLLPLVAYLLREAHRQILSRLDTIETNVTRRLDHIESRLDTHVEEDAEFAQQIAVQHATIVERVGGILHSMKGRKQ